MANTINSYFENAQMAMAAYAQGLTPTMSLDNYKLALREAGMSQKQAEVFADTYAVVDQFTDSLTGFSGTVFSKNGVNYFAIRGTEGFSFSGAQSFSDSRASRPTSAPTASPSARVWPCSTGSSGSTLPPAPRWRNTPTTPSSG